MTTNNITSSSVNINISDYINLPTKQCSTCHQIKLLTEYTKNKNLSDGLLYECKSCAYYTNKKYREKYKDEISQRKKKYSAENKDRIAEHQKEYRKLNKDKLVAKNKNTMKTIKRK